MPPHAQAIGISRNRRCRLPLRPAGQATGVAAVLFVGLAFGALHPDMKLPEFVYLFGLVVFVYAIGLSSGAAFFASFRDKGLRDNLFILGMLVVGAALTSVAWWLGGFHPA